MEKKLFVGNLPFESTEDDLRSLFEDFGEVTSAKVVIDRETGKSRGFGFIEMETAEQARKALEGMDGYKHDRRALRVSEARGR